MAREYYCMNTTKRSDEKATSTCWNCGVEIPTGDNFCSVDCEVDYTLQDPYREERFEDPPQDWEKNT